MELPAALRPAVAAAVGNALLAAPALAEPGKIFDFNLTLPLMAGQFLILMVILDKLVYSPVGKVLDDRDAQLRTKLEAVKDNSSDLLKYSVRAGPENRQCCLGAWRPARRPRAPRRRWRARQQRPRAAARAARWPAGAPAAPARRGCGGALCAASPRFSRGHIWAPRAPPRRAARRMALGQPLGAPRALRPRRAAPRLPPARC